MSVAIYLYGITPNGSVVVVDERAQTCYYFSDAEIELIESGFVPASVPEKLWDFIGVWGCGHDIKELWSAA